MVEGLGSRGRGTRAHFPRVPPVLPVLPILPILPIPKASTHLHPTSNPLACPALWTCVNEFSKRRQRCTRTADFAAPPPGASPRRLVSTRSPCSVTSVPRKRCCVR